MAEVLVEFDNRLVGPDGHAYEARACGREREDGLWEGWVEFVSLDGGPVTRTARETTQPNQKDAKYWATGLTAAYLEGALHRALTSHDPAPKRPEVHAEPHYDAPASHHDEGAGRKPRAVLDPFAVYEEGDDLLRSQLGALSEGRLRNIVRAYELSEHTATELGALAKPDLVELIMTEVARRQ